MRVRTTLCFKSITFFCLIIAVFSFSAPSFSQDFKFKKIGKSFSHPWGITVYADNEVLITEKGGNLFKVNIKNGSKIKIKNLPNVFNVFVVVKASPSSKPASSLQNVVSIVRCHI